MNKFFAWIKKYWKATLIVLAFVGAAIWGFFKFFFSDSGRTNFVKDPSDKNKIIVKDPKTGQAIGIKLPDGVNNDKVDTVSKPVDIQTKPVEVNNNAVNRKEIKNEKTDPDIPVANESAAAWLGSNNPNFKG